MSFGKVSDFAAGGILLGMSALLLIPTTLGLAEYENNDSEEKTSQTNFNKIVQAVVLAVAVIGLFLGGALMLVNRNPEKHSIKGTARPALSTGAKGNVKPALGGGRTRRNVTDFELF